MKRNLISVVIPAKDRIEFTSDAILSVTKQKIPNNMSLEIIVIDNRSNPPLSKKLSKIFPNVLFINNSRKDHPGGSRNVGLLKTKGEYIAFLDNDDQWKDNFLLESVKNIKQSNVSATLVLTDQYFYGKFPFFRKIKLTILNLIRYIFLIFFYYFHKKTLPQSAFYLCQISHMMFKRVSIGNNHFNENEVAAEDWEFVADVTENGKIKIIPKRLVKFRYEIRSNTNSPKV